MLRTVVDRTGAAAVRLAGRRSTAAAEEVQAGVRNLEVLRNRDRCRSTDREEARTGGDRVGGEKEEVHLRTSAAADQDNPTRCAID